MSNLDARLRAEMRVELVALLKRLGMTAIAVTHNQEEALAMSDRIAVMRDGHILQVGSPREIYDNPNCRFVADFIGEANLIPGDLLGRSSSITVTVRPERISIRSGPNGKPARIEGVVSGVTFLGLDTLYEVALPQGTRLRARLRDSEDRFRHGDRVAVDWPDGVERQLAN
jgi:spermidine/putrescine transport system ATP-binding protein